jgi:rSAM/selenodomain-associated transferase 1
MAPNQQANSPVGIAIFAKAPIPHQTKTRLVPLLGAERAASLQAQLTERAVSTATEAGVGPVTLWCAPDATHQSFVDMECRFEISLFSQQGNELGARMAHAFEVLTPTYPLLLMGTDCPSITASILQDCSAALQTHALVFLPVEDGGYCLIGAKQLHPTLFDMMPWGTADVMALTRSRALEAGLSLAEPVLLFDIDRPVDYRRALAAGLVRE